MTITLIDRFRCATCGAGGHRMDFMGDQMHCSACGDEFSLDEADGLAPPSVTATTLTVGVGDLVTYLPRRGLSDPEPVPVAKVNRRTVVVYSPRWGRLMLDPKRITSAVEP